MSRATIVITGQPPLPGNSQYTYLLDSTKGLVTTISASAASQAPGSYRHKWAGGRVRATIKNGNQAVTCNLHLLTDSSGTTSSAWEVDTTAQLAGSFTISASTTVVIDWLPRSSDFRVEIVAGGTTTSALTTTARIDFDATPAV